MFWLGDLNFRIDKGRHTVEDVVKAIVEQDHPNFEDLLRTDELLNCLLHGKNIGALCIIHILYRHDITEILLKVALNTITLSPNFYFCCKFYLLRNLNKLLQVQVASIFIRIISNDITFRFVIT